jgi:hypothetical protein
MFWNNYIRQSGSVFTRGWKWEDLKGSCFDCPEEATHAVMNEDEGGPSLYCEDCVNYKLRIWKKKYPEINVIVKTIDELKVEEVLDK